MKRVSLCLLCLVVIVAFSTCWVDDKPPDPVAGSCNNNGTCELREGEDCTTCPADCPCCSAIDAKGYNVDHPEQATKEPDGQSAVLKKDSTLTLLIGREIYNKADGADFSLVGEVMTASSGSVVAGCPTGIPQGDGFLIEVSETGEEPWQSVGFWTKTVVGDASVGGNSSFEMGCSGMASARYVRLTALANATAKLDALTASSCEK